MTVHRPHELRSLQKHNRVIVLLFTLFDITILNMSKSTKNENPHFLLRDSVYIQKVFVHLVTHRLTTNHPTFLTQLYVIYFHLLLIHRSIATYSMNAVFEVSHSRVDNTESQMMMALRTSVENLRFTFK